MKKRYKKIAAVCMTLLLLISLFPINGAAKAASTLGNKLLVGYWHNFDNNSKLLKLREVSNDWDVVNVSFGETAASDRGTVLFEPFYDESEFISDVKYLQGKGKKVVLSIGGQNGTVVLANTGAKDRFVKSMSDLIDRYGFDGLDIDLEHDMNSADDFKNPKVPQNVNLIAACKELHNKYGSDFILAMAPETAYVQGKLMSGSGGYLPLIYGVKDILTYIHVQLYNSGGMTANDGQNYTQGNADFIVSMTEMLLNGFEVGWGSGNMFPALREDQVLIGLPATTQAANGGYVKSDEVIKALDYLIHGKSFGGRYKLQKEGGYPGLRGAMSWSCNWDAYDNFSWTKPLRNYFGNIKPIENILQKASISSTSPVNNSFTITTTIPSRNTATTYKLYEGSNIIASGNLEVGSSTDKIIAHEIKNKEVGSYEYSVDVSDAKGETLKSNKIIVRIDPAEIDKTKIDVNKDGKIDILDLTLLSTYYNVKSGDSRYDVKYDINVDKVIDIFDLVLVAREVGNEIDPPIEEYPNDTYDPNVDYPGGSIVIYHNVTYRAQWWTKGEIPGEPWNAWVKV